MNDATSAAKTYANLIACLLTGDEAVRSLIAKAKGIPFGDAEAHVDEHLNIHLQILAADPNSEHQASKPSVNVSRLLDASTDKSNLLFLFHQWRNCSGDTDIDVFHAGTVIIESHEGRLQAQAAHGGGSASPPKLNDHPGPNKRPRHPYSTLQSWVQCDRKQAQIDKVCYAEREKIRKKWRDSRKANFKGTNASGASASTAVDHAITAVDTPTNDANSKALSVMISLLAALASSIKDNESDHTKSHSRLGTRKRSHPYAHSPTTAQVDTVPPQTNRSPTSQSTQSSSKRPAARQSTLAEKEISRLELAPRMSTSQHCACWASPKLNLSWRTREEAQPCLYVGLCLSTC